MGASKNHKLERHAALFLDWYNLGPMLHHGGERMRPVDPNWIPPDEPTTVRALRGNLGRRLCVLAHLHQPTPDVRWRLRVLKKGDPLLRGKKPHEILATLLAHAIGEFLPIPHSLAIKRGGGPWPGGTAEWVPDFQGLLPVDRQWATYELQARPIIYGYVRLLQDMWEKGFKRLKPCAWLSCARLFWDPTTTQAKRYCEGLHDAERLIEREKKARLRKARRR